MGENGASAGGSDRASKAEQLFEFAEEHLFSPPEYDHSPGRCKECEEEVEIDLNLRPCGMAESCQEHRPLCRFVEGSCHV